MPRKSSLEININNAHGNLIHISILMLIFIMLILFNTGSVIFYKDVNCDYSESKALSIPIGEQDDVYELFGLTTSLKKHILPYWNLEYADRFGYLVIDYPFYVYINSIILSVFGESFGSISFINLFYLLLVFIAILKIIYIDKQNESLGFAGFIPVIIFSSFMWLLLKQPDFFVLATHLFGLFLMISFYFLLKGRHNLFLFFAFLTFLQKISGSVLILLCFVSFFFFLKLERRIIVKLFLYYSLAVIAYFTFVIILGIQQGYLPVYIERFLQENFYRFDYLGIMNKFFSSKTLNAWPKFNLNNTVDFFKWFLMGTSFAGIFLFARQKDRISSYFSFIGVGYFILVLISKHKTIYYIEPLVFLAAIVATRYCNVSHRSRSMR